MDKKTLSISNPFSYRPMREMEGKICWHINDLCNLKCPYCFFPFYEKEHPAVGRLSPEQIVEAFNKTQRRWHLYISGGEPLLYPNFAELVNLLKPYHPVQISTNLFNKYVKEFANKVTPDNIIIINASLHILQHNENSLKQFIRNYHLFFDKGFPIVVTYVTYPPLFSRIREDFEYLKKQGIRHIHPLTFQGIYEGKTYPGHYTPEQIKIISELAIDKNELFIATNNLNFKDKLCRAGKDYFYMEINGDVFSCVSTREYCGNLFEGTFLPAEHPIKCPVAHCYDSCLGITSLVEEPELPAIEMPHKSNISLRFLRVKQFLADRV